MIRILVLFAVGLLTACAQTQLSHQSESLNRASGSTMAEQVLLNAVRASLDLPMSFTKLQKYTANGMVSASLTPKFPFGPQAINSNDLGPSVSLNPGVFQIEYADVNTAGALTKLNESLQYDAYDRYLRDGIPGPVVGNVFISYIEVHELLGKALRVIYEDTCIRGIRSQYSRSIESDQQICASLHDIKHVEQCAFWYEERIFILENKEPFYIIENHARDKCGILTFRSLRLMLRLSSFSSDLVPGEEKKEKSSLPKDADLRIAVLLNQVGGGDGAKAPSKEVRPEQGIRFQDPRIHEVFVALQRCFKWYSDQAASRSDTDGKQGKPAPRTAASSASAKDKPCDKIHQRPKTKQAAKSSNAPRTKPKQTPLDRPEFASMRHRAPIKFALRSPRQILNYLGDLIALQNFSEPQYLPDVAVGEGKRAVLFRVVRGSPGPTQVALSVVGPNGDRFYVPQPAYGNTDRDQTLRVLSIATELVNGAISEKDFPAPTSITVRAIQ